MRCLTVVEKLKQEYPEISTKIIDSPSSVFIKVVLENKADNYRTVRHINRNTQNLSVHQALESVALGYITDKELTIGTRWGGQF